MKETNRHILKSTMVSTTAAVKYNGESCGTTRFKGKHEDNLFLERFKNRAAFIPREIYFYHILHCQTPLTHYDEYNLKSDV